MWNDSEEDIVTRDLHQLIVDEGSDEGKRCGRETYNQSRCRTQRLTSINSQCRTQRLKKRKIGG